MKTVLPVDLDSSSQEPRSAVPSDSEGSGPEMTQEASGLVIATDSDAPPPVFDPVMYLRQAESLLLELEESWERGAAEPVLEECSRFLEPLTLKSYRACIRKGVPPPFRRALLEGLLKQFAHEVRPPLHVFPARADVRKGPSPASPGVLFPLESGLLVGNSAVTRIRVSQALAARRWGVWYALDSPEAQTRLEASWVRNVIGVFETNLREMNRLPKNARLDKAPWDPGSVGVWFEQLVIDILNEQEYVARRAPLHEDLFEKTDVRVSYRGLQRKRGARVQVTLLTDEGLHDAKLRRIAHGDEFVVVSPLTLAKEALRPGGMLSLRPEQRNVFFAALSQPAQSPGKVAASLKKHFLQALGNRDSPLGPVLAVATPIRRFIRKYVESEARDATRYLRTREARSNVPWTPPPWRR